MTQYTHKIDLDVLFKEFRNQKKIFAEWVNGIFLIKYGKMVESKSLSYLMYFETEKYTFIRLLNGRVIEKHSLNGDFDFDEIEDDIDPNLLKLIKEYKNKSL